jgi:methyl-accepting chemotaxis protein
MKLKLKLPLLVISGTLTTAFVLGWVALMSSKSTISGRIDQRSEAVIIERKIALNQLYEDIEKDIKFIAKDGDMLAAFNEFSSAWMSENLNTSYLQENYITKNPHPNGKKLFLDSANDGSKYSEAHEKFHPWFRRYLEKGKYYDIFLMDLNGNVMYTVCKEQDFASNITSGEGKKTDLGEVYSRALDPSAKSGDVFFSDFKPYAPSANVPAAFVATPVIENGVKVGVVAFQMPIEKIHAIFLSRDSFYDYEEIFLVGSDKMNRSPVNYGKERSVLTQTVNTEAAQKALAGKHGNLEGLNYNMVMTRTSYMPFEFKNIKWAILFEEELTGAYKDYYKLQGEIIWLSTIITLIMAALFYFGVQQIVINPLSIMGGNLVDLAHNRTNINIFGLDRKDEFLDLAQSAEKFRANIIKTQELQATQKALEEKAENERKQLMAELADSFEHRMQSVVSGVATAATELAKTAEGMSVLSTNSNSTIISANQSALSITLHVDSVATAAEELHSSVREISSQVYKSNDLIGDSVDKVQSADTYAKKLEESTEKVKEVIRLIADISSQINLLALNATIESARAGESGKGFAVVANEVKNLASQTNKSVDEIAKVIDEMGEVSSGIIDALENVKGSVNRISEASVSIASAVEEQTVATNEIAKSAKEASQGTQMVSSGFEMVQGSSLEVNSASKQMSDAAKDLSMQAEALRLEVSSFIAEIRNN